MTRQPTEMEMRVAKALGKFECGCDECDCFAFPELYAKWEGYFNAARAAIRAMSEPTEGQQRIGAQAMWDCGDLVGYEQASQIWQAMIDAASPPEE